MPWRTPDIMSVREEFVLLALQEGANRRQLCERFGISRQTGYTWLARYTQGGREALSDQSRRPHRSPRTSSLAIESAVLAVREQHPAWGGRKISRRLQDLGLAHVAPSTVTTILQRHGRILPEDSERSTAWKRFEHVEPNALWQADFKGHFDTAAGRCWPLTVLDDHSRFNVMLQACSNTRTETIQVAFEAGFRRYGMPTQMNFDNGAPWGSPSAPGHLTALTVWLVRLGIHVSYSRPRHPQTNGKDERFHRSLKAEVLQGHCFEDLAQVQVAFDRWRHIYNAERPHEALAMKTPLSRYRPSRRDYPQVLPPIEYGPDDEIVQVRDRGLIRFRGGTYKLTNALVGLSVAIRPDLQHEGCFDVRFAHHRCLRIDLNKPETRRQKCQ